MSSPKRAPLWSLIVERGICRSRSEAEAIVLAGEVVVEGVDVPKAGASIDRNSKIRLKNCRGRFVSRGGEKLDGALRIFNIDVRSLVALDAGASTGGFCDCLIQRGASRVYAVDAGYGQLAGSLRNDSRIINMEKTNLGSISRDDLDPLPDIITLDLSYLSLRTALPLAVGLSSPNSRIVSLIKPLYEIEDAHARRTGIIDSRDAYREVLARLADQAGKIGLTVVDVIESPIRGSSGAVEFFFHLVSAGAPEPGIYDRIDQVVAGLDLRYSGGPAA